MWRDGQWWLSLLVMCFSFGHHSCMFLIFPLVVEMQHQVSLPPAFLLMMPQFPCLGVFLYGQLSMSVGIPDHLPE